MRRTFVALLLAVSVFGPVAEVFARDTPEGMKPLAIACFLRKAEPVTGEAGKVSTPGSTLQIQILVHESPEYGKSQIAETHDPSGILKGNGFLRFDYIPDKPAKYALWTDELKSAGNMMLQVDRSAPDRANAVLAKEPDDPSFRYLGTCLGLRSDDTYRDFERMKEQHP